MNQVEALLPGPVLLHVVDFEDAVGGHPGNWRWKQIDAANVGYCQSETSHKTGARERSTLWKHIGNITGRSARSSDPLSVDLHSPSSFAGPNIQDIHRGVAQANRRAKEWILPVTF